MFESFFFHILRENISPQGMETGLQVQKNRNRVLGFNVFLVAHTKVPSRREGLRLQNLLAKKTDSVRGVLQGGRECGRSRQGRGLVEGGIRYEIGGVYECVLSVYGDHHVSGVF